MLSFDSASADPDPDWFRLKLIDDPAYPQGGKRWVLDNPLAEWSRDGYDYPVPVIADEFGEYTEE